MIQIYLAQGFRRFVLLTGYRAELIEQFVARRAVAGRHGASSASDTGLDTPTGGRLRTAPHGARPTSASA